MGQEKDSSGLFTLFLLLSGQLPVTTLGDNDFCKMHFWSEIKLLLPQMQQKDVGSAQSDHWQNTPTCIQHPAHLPLLPFEVSVATLQTLPGVLWQLTAAGSPLPQYFYPSQ